MTERTKRILAMVAIPLLPVLVPVLLVVTFFGILYGTTRAIIDEFIPTKGAKK